jgi:hypothetical protein
MQNFDVRHHNEEKTNSLGNFNLIMANIALVRLKISQNLLLLIIGSILISSKFEKQLQRLSVYIGVADIVMLICVSRTDHKIRPPSYDYLICCIYLN